MTDSMNMSMSGMSYMAPLWLIYSLAVFFLAGFLFYYYRLTKADSVKAVYGYHDRQNEGAHGLCMLAMASALAPPLWQIPSLVWAVVLGLAAIFFLVRANTWGRKLAYNKWWWDWAHVGMLVGMALMFMPIDTGSFSYVLEAFWLWFAGYYTYSLIHDLQEPKVYYIGSDVSHLVMGIVMFIMTAFPMALMGPGSSMPGMNMSICHGMSNMSGMDNHMSHMDMPTTPSPSPHQP